MGMNFGKVNDAARDAEANRGVGAGYIILKDGETARVRFVGGPDEPFQVKQHWHAKTSRNYTCAEGWKGHPGCILCHNKANPPKAEPGAHDGGKSQSDAIGWPAVRFAFSLISDRRVHETKRMEEGKERKRLTTCRGKGCQLCADGLEPVREGKKYLELALRYARALSAAVDAIGARCGACKGVGELTVKSLECSECGHGGIRAPEGAEIVVCPECAEEMRPAKVLACDQGCALPFPRDVQDCWWDVTRTGAGQATTYSFTPLAPKALGDEDKAVEPWDFKRVFRPKDQADLAGALGLANPWGPVKSSGGQGGVLDDADGVGDDDFPA